MTRFQSYRAVTPFLVAVFCVFNVGIPVVVAACPMSEANGALCGFCFSFPDDGMPGYTTHQDRSCCETVLASEGSKVEFLKTAGTLPTSYNMLFVTIVTPPDRFSHSISSLTVLSADTSPGCSDLPVLLSTLLL